MSMNSWLKNLKARLGLAPASPSRRRRNAYRPMIESLENRIVPTVTSTFDSFGLLTVTSNNDSDTVTIRSDPFNGFLCFVRRHRIPLGVFPDRWSRQRRCIRGHQPAERQYLFDQGIRSSHKRLLRGVWTLGRRGRTGADQVRYEQGARRCL